MCGMKLVATAAAPPTYACPMYPEVTSAEPGRCHECGMKLLAVQPVEQPSVHGTPTTRHSPHNHDHGAHGDDRAAPKYVPGTAHRQQTRSCQPATAP